MVIINSRKIIFLHIPKSAGSSLTEFIDQFLAWDDIVVGTTTIGELFQKYWSPRYGIGKHSVPSHIINMMGKERYKAYYKFIVVREPYQRFLSAFKFINNMKKIKAPWFECSTDYAHLENIVRPEQLLESKYFNDIQLKKPEECTEVELFFKNQKSFLDIEEFSESRFRYFKLEDLAADIKPLSIFLGVVTKKGLPHSNKTHPSDDFDIEYIQEKVYKIYKSDYSFFGYKC